MYFTKTPYIFRKLLSSALWKKEKSQKIYLTFDDGPMEGVTEEILDCLDQYAMKATFFCLGSNVRKYPELYRRIVDAGHGVGLHGEDHNDGWKTEKSVYLDNISKAREVIESDLFRPPYGRLTKRQYAAIRKKYKIVFWDLMPGDFDEKKSPEQCFHHIVDNIFPGAIIVLHDNIISQERVLSVLLKLCNWLKANNWSTEILAYSEAK